MLYSDFRNLFNSCEDAKWDTDTKVLPMMIMMDIVEGSVMSVFFMWNKTYMQQKILTKNEKACPPRVITFL